jgi:hypothetical protein
MPLLGAVVLAAALGASALATLACVWLVVHVDATPQLLVALPGLVTGLALRRLRHLRDTLFSVVAAALAGGAVVRYLEWVVDDRDTIRANGGFNGHPVPLHVLLHDSGVLRYFLDGLPGTFAVSALGWLVAGAVGAFLLIRVTFPAAGVRADD